MNSNESIEEDVKKDLKSSIGHHSTYIWETKRIIEEYEDARSFDELKKRVVEDNILNKGSEEYRKRLLNEVALRYSLNRDGYEETPLARVLTSDLSDSLKDWVLYYEYSQDNTVRVLTQRYLYPKYQEGALTVTKTDVQGFIEGLEGEFPEVGEWTEDTKENVAQHYLAALKNFGILEGSQEKEFKYIHPPDKLIAYVLYSLFERDVTTPDAIVGDDDWKLLFLDESDARDRIIGISPEFVRYEQKGSVERIDPKYDSVKECVDDF